MSGPHEPPKPTPRTPTFGDLIAQIESADHGFWGLSLDIAIMLGWQYKSSGQGWATYINPDGLSVGMPLDCASSLDLALTLVEPPGYSMWTWKVEARIHGSERRYHTYQAEITVPSRKWQGFASTPALAMCAAAMRMRRDLTAPKEAA